MALRHLARFSSNIRSTLKTPPALKSISLLDDNKYSTMSSEGHATISYVTTPNEDVARQLSSKLVENKLAACVNIVKNVESIYRWEDKIEQDSEVLLIIKSHSSKSDDLAAYVRSNHPYDCPEVVTIKVDSGSEPYLKWVREQVQTSSTQD